ncbi:MAG: HD-GYP domain-containing protein [bacterium]
MHRMHNRRILVTDDQPEVVEDYLRILKSRKVTGDELDALERDLFGETSGDNPGSQASEIQYNVSTARQGEEAISRVKKALEEDDPFAVAFLDVRMPPGIDGVHAAREIRRMDPNIHIVFVTAYSDFSHTEICRLMESTDKYLFLRKPFDADEIRQLALALSEKWQLDKMVNERTRELQITRTVGIRALAELAELRDCTTGTHLKRVAEYSKLIARILSRRKEPKWCKYITEQYIQDIGESSVLHDIGKIGIPDNILLKPGRLTPKERELMKIHTTIGGDTLAKAVEEIEIQSFLTLGREIAYHHHEWFNGSGYPRGLKGEEIPLSARIVALADVYDALTSDRPYRKAYPHATAFRLITGKRGKVQFDPVVLESFLHHEEAFKNIHSQYRNHFV